jgi:general secretion pathway protein A
MDYFNILSLNREPFSNSPDPDFFFQSQQHRQCLQKLELALRLRRGLNVVIGAVGTGKTTLCRELIRKFSEDDDIETHLILDPDFAGPVEFLAAVAEMFEGKRPATNADQWEIKEAIKQSLFRKGVDKNKTVVLIVDEGQKIPIDCLELLREFLNYETNEYKLLQIAIFAQTEFEETLAGHANFADRINLKHVLGPMAFKDTRAMIQYRLAQSQQGQKKAASLFTLPAFYAIYRATGGYPRKIIHLCHQCMLGIIIQNRSRVTRSLVRSCVDRDMKGRKRWIPVAVTAVLIAGILFMDTGTLERFFSGKWRIGPDNTPDTTTVEKVPAGSPAVNATVQAPVGEKAPAGSNLSSEPAAPVTNVPPPPENPIRPEEPAVVVTTASGPEPELSPVAPKQLPPDSLGTVKLEKRETLWRLVEKVHGVFEPSYLKALEEINPHIRNPRRVEVGDVVTVPAIPVRLPASPPQRWWVAVAETTHLEDAIEVLRTYPEDGPKIRIISSWNPKEGLKFRVILSEIFRDETTARYRMETLPAGDGLARRLFSAWDPETIFYANPYRRPRR